MTLRVKICGLTDAASVDAALEAGADAVGFVFYAPSPRHLDIPTAKLLIARVPAAVTSVVVMLHPAADYCAEVIDALQPDALQTDIDDFASLKLPASVEHWPVVREHRVDDLQQLPPRFLYEGAGSGKGKLVDWSRAADLATRAQLILAGGLRVDNVVAAVQQVRPWAVDVSSGVESRPGQKDATLIRQFITAAKAA